MKYYPLIMTVFGVAISLVFLTVFIQSGGMEIYLFSGMGGTILVSLGIMLHVVEMNKTKRLEFLQTFENYLAAFDSHDMDDLSQREVAFLALYDLYQRLLSKVCVEYCKISQNRLKEYPLTELWNQVRSLLLKVENVSKKWDMIFQTLSKMHLTFCQKDRIPSKLALEQIRKKTPKFTTWVIKAGEKYDRIIFSRFVDDSPMF